jgi:hypothetical protein
MGAEFFCARLSMTKNSLKYSEWMVVGSFLLILCSLFLIAKLSSVSVDKALSDPMPAALYEVEVEGAVSKPGKYKIEAGTPIVKALKKARVKPFADLAPLTGVVDRSMTIKVEELQEITIKLKGAVVDAAELVLPAKTRICDLKGVVQFTDDVDKTFFRKRRLLKNGEIIVVPEKQKKKPLVDKSAHPI